MTRMQKLHYMDSSDKKIWSVLKNILFFFSIGIMVYWGYLESNNEKPTGNKPVDRSEQNISGENQNSDSIYYAFTKIISGYSRARK